MSYGQGPEATATPEEQSLAQLLDRIQQAAEELPGLAAAAKLTLAQSAQAAIPAQPRPAPGVGERPDLLVIDPAAQTYQEALDLLRNAYQVNEYGNPRVHYCPGPVVWTKEDEGGWRSQWDEEMLRTYAAGLPDNAMLLVWRICSSPGKPVEAREVGALLIPDGTDQQQMTAASVAVAAANRHAKQTVDRRAPLTKTYPGRQRGAGRVRYTVAPPVATILLAAIRESDAFPRLCRAHPGMLALVQAATSTAAMTHGR